jgi:hypothetical protein
MLPKERLRRADILFSFLVVLAGAAILINAMGFPRGAELSGVRNDWYVSPALMPYIIGTGLVLMGIALFITGLKEAGTAGLREILDSIGRLFTRRPAPGAGSLRFLAVTITVVLTVFLYMPRVDFVISAAFLLVALMTMFAFEDDVLLKRLLILYVLLAAPMIAYFASGLGARFEKAFYYASDIPGGLFLALYIVLAARTAGRERRGRFLRLVLIAFAVPLLLVPVFKYLLYIPFPREGGVVALMDYVRFDLLDPVQE